MATEKIPQYEIDAIVRTFLPNIKSFFENEKYKEEFKEWKSSKDKIVQMIKQQGAQKLSAINSTI